MLEVIYEELKQECKRWGDKDYNGIVFVHPEDKKFLVRHLLMEYNLTSVNNYKFKLHSGGALQVSTLDIGKSPYFDYMGCEFTTIIISKEAFGKYTEDYNFILVNEDLCKGNIPDFYMYMLTRNRSQSKCHSKMIIV